MLFGLKNATQTFQRLMDCVTGSSRGSYVGASASRCSNCSYYRCFRFHCWGCPLTYSTIVLRASWVCSLRLRFGRQLCIIWALSFITQHLIIHKRTACVNIFTAPWSLHWGLPWRMTTGMTGSLWCCWDFGQPLRRIYWLVKQSLFMGRHLGCMATLFLVWTLRGLDQNTIPLCEAMTSLLFQCPPLRMNLTRLGFPMIYLLQNLCSFDMMHTEGYWNHHMMGHSRFWSPQIRHS